MDGNWSALPRFGIWIGIALILTGVAWVGVESPADGSPAAFGPLFAFSLPGFFLLMNSSEYIRCTRPSGSPQRARAVCLMVMNAVVCLALLPPFMEILLDLPSGRTLELVPLEQIRFLAGSLGMPVAAGFAYKFLDLLREARTQASAA